MRIDLPNCGFKNCKYCFDGICTKAEEYDRCEYIRLKMQEYSNILNNLSI